MKNKENVLYGRQGDVHFVNRSIPENARRVPLRPFALGEVTGHSHSVISEDAPSVEMYELDVKTYIRVSGECDGIRIKHEDHDPTATKSLLPAGWEGEVIIAQEYDEEEGFRSLAD
jgi:hypothetical protein